MLARSAGIWKELELAARPEMGVKTFFPVGEKSRGNRRVDVGLGRSSLGPGVLAYTARRADGPPVVGTESDEVQSLRQGPEVGARCTGGLGLCLRAFWPRTGHELGDRRAHALVALSPGRRTREAWQHVRLRSSGWVRGTPSAHAC